jgi:hypothetical protein
MMTIFLALSLVLPARAMDIPKLAPNNKSAAAELKAALEAHMDGDDAKARRRLAVCIKKAAPDSADLSGCRIYLEWWAKDAKQIDRPSPPEARKLYTIGADSYKKKNFELADEAWHECITYSVVGTAVRNDCMAMIDLIPRTPLPAVELKIRQVYLEGFILYSEGDFAKARTKWTVCLASAPKDGPTWSDCRAGLAKLDADKPKP